MILYSFAREAVHEGNLILVNREYSLLRTGQFRRQELIAIDDRFPEIMLRRKTARQLVSLFKRIQSKTAIVPVSGYRSLREQTNLYEDSWKENGEEYTKKFVARPNQSEHQTGLAIDVAEYSEQIDFICPEFSYEGIALQFRNHAADYGFIERYPKGKEAITGIAHEPWHFRYVGTPHAKVITMLGMTLEEYIEYLKQFPYGLIQKTDRKGISESVLTEGLVYQHGEEEYHIYYLKAQEEERIMISLPDDCEFELSGNNADGFILTVKKQAKKGEQE